jgi:type VI secretion system protein ImpK
VRLIDAFTDILYFTVVNKDIEFGQFSHLDLYDRYREMISLAELKCRESGVGDSVWRTALFSVATWIDEVILLSEWPQRSLWQKQSLQRTYFHTNNGGVEFYKHLSTLDGSQTEVLKVFDVVMSMGFKGELFRDQDNLKRQQISDRTMQLLKNDSEMQVPSVLFNIAYGKNVELPRETGKMWAILKRGALIMIPPLVFVLLYVMMNSKLAEMLAFK